MAYDPKVSGERRKVHDPNRSPERRTAVIGERRNQTHQARRKGDDVLQLSQTILRSVQAIEADLKIIKSGLENLRKELERADILHPEALKK